MKPARTIREKVESLKCAGEVEGAREQIKAEGRMTPEIDNLLKMRLREIQNTNGHQ